VQARPDGFDRASWLRPRLERLGAGVVAIAGLMTGAARLIPYCARHHPLHLKDNGCRGSACSPLSGQEGRRPQTARVITRCNLKNNGYPAHHPPHFLRGGWLGWPSLRASTEHSIRPCPELINPECAVREHNGQPCRPPLFPVCATREHVRPPALHAPLVTCAMREHEGLAWPPRLSALRQPRRRFPEVSTLTKGGRDLLTAGPARSPQYPGSLARPRRSAARESLGSR